MLSATWCERLGCGLAAVLLQAVHLAAQDRPEAAMTISTETLTFEIGNDGLNRAFADRHSGTDHGARPATPVASIAQDGKIHPATSARQLDGGRLLLAFGDSGATATLAIVGQARYLTVEVVAVGEARIDSLTFLDVPMALTGALTESFAGCAVALNLQTQVAGILGPSRLLRATCYPRFGLVGAKVAVIGCPQAALRAVLQEVVSAAPDLPQSAVGGPWALDAPAAYGSYLFNTDGISEAQVDDWIRLCHRLGVNQIDFHGGSSHRFGDCEPDPRVYPQGRASFKAVIDRLHEAGILAGLHTYACFMAKTCPWVTPVPDPRLGKDATFTLAAALDESASTVPVVETTAAMSTITGFFVRNSVTLQIGDELIVYAGLSKEPPYAFTECQRGAYGTRRAAHAEGAQVHHLRECFGLFVPDGDSTLFAEVAASTAEMANECGFDFIYLDALDGGDAIAGPENAWHYESKFAFEIWRRLKRPVMAEMSTFHHHLWFVRSRMGAWDHPTRSHKRFIDIHVKANEACQRMFLPAHLGWWAFKTWSGPQGEPTFPDDIEYLCGKALGNACGLSIMGITPATAGSIPALPRLAAIMQRYESLRQANYFAPEVKDRLRVPGDEFTLSQGPDGEWEFHRLQHERHKVVGLDSPSAVWTVTNRSGRQPLRLRIEALTGVGPYDAPDAIVLADFAAPEKDFPERAAQPGISAQLEPSTDPVKAGPVSGHLTATNGNETPVRSWARFGKKFAPTLNLAAQQALGLWVHGDGKGQVLNLQIQSPPHISHGDGARYLVVDFSGWRYVELVEHEGERHADYSWPYGGGYATYRETVQMSAVETLNLYLNNIPAKDTVSCHLSPLKALPTTKVTLRNPAISVGGKTVVFPVEIETGSYLEFRSADDCTLHAPTGAVLAAVRPQGEVPMLESGLNEVRFHCEAEAGVNPRAYVSVFAQGEPLRGRNPSEAIDWRFLRREDDEPRTVRALDGVQNQWEVRCRPEPAGARLAAEIVVESIADPGSLYGSPEAIALETFDTLDAFADGPANEYLRYVVSPVVSGVPTAPGVTHELALSTELVKQGRTSARYTATSTNPGGWSARGRRFTPLLDLSACTHIGFLVHGDGNGQILNLQLRDSRGAWHDLKVGIGFSGWKYHEFALTGTACDLSQIEYLIVYFNALPAAKTCTCHVDDIRAWRDPAYLRHPSLAIGEARVVFPSALQAGSRLVYEPGGECLVYGPDGKQVERIQPVGEPLVLAPGTNRVRFSAEANAVPAFRVQVRTTKVYGP